MAMKLQTILLSSLTPTKCFFQFNLDDLVNNLGLAVDLRVFDRAHNVLYTETVIKIDESSVDELPFMTI